MKQNVLKIYNYYKYIYESETSYLLKMDALRAMYLIHTIVSAYEFENEFMIGKLMLLDNTDNETKSKVIEFIYGKIP